MKEAIKRILANCLAVICILTSASNKEPNEVKYQSLGIEQGTYLQTYVNEEIDYYLDYYLYIPDKAVKNMPLIVFLHGDGVVNKLDQLENHGLIQSVKEIYGEDFPFLVLSPCTRTASWIKYGIPETLKKLIDDVVEKYSINVDKIIITGHSRGAIGVWHMIGEYGDYFSAAVPVSCSNETNLNVENMKNVPIWALVGGGYNDYNTYGKMLDIIAGIINKYDGNCTVTVVGTYNHGDMATAGYTKEVFEWMLEQ